MTLVASLICGLSLAQASAGAPNEFFVDTTFATVDADVRIVLPRTSDPKSRFRPVESVDWNRQVKQLSLKGSLRISARPVARTFGGTETAVSMQGEVSLQSIRVTPTSNSEGRITATLLVQIKGSDGETLVDVQETAEMVDGQSLVFVSEPGRKVTDGWRKRQIVAVRIFKAQ
jgi:hypothetical protein